MILNITANDVKAKLAPFSADNVFSIGNDTNDSITEAEVLQIVETQERRALSLLPEKYRRLVEGYVSGEVLARHSEKDQTNYSLSFAPVSSGTVSLYLNFPKDTAWIDRKPIHRTDAGYSVNYSGGTLTFNTAPAPDTFIVAEYRHTNQALFTWLRECVLSFVAVELSRRFSFFTSTDGQERFNAWEAQALASLKDAGKYGYMGIEQVDNLQLIEDVRPDTYRALFYV